MRENLPPFPGTEETPSNTPSLIAYILRGREWVQIGTAAAHSDGMGHELPLALGTEDGDAIQLRAVDPAYYPGNQRAPRAKRRPWTSRPKPRT